MARLKNSFEFIGSLGNISAYTMKGSDKVIIRTKGGASKEKIKTLENFARTREINNEWTGCTRAGKSIFICLQPVRHLADFSMIGSPNGIAKRIQKLDTMNIPGERSIDFSKHREMLEGFQLNRQNSFDILVRRPAIFDISREKATAVVQFPSLTPGIHLLNRSQRPYFRFIAVLAILSDIEYSGDYSVYGPLNPDVHTKNTSAGTDWFPAFEPFNGATIELNAGNSFGDTESLLLAAGIEFGNPTTEGMEPVKYSGGGKILAVK